MSIATTFFVVAPLLFLIVTFLPPYSNFLGFDKPAEQSKVLPPKQALPVLARQEPVIEQKKVAVAPVSSLPAPKNKAHVFIAEVKEQPLSVGESYHVSAIDDSDGHLVDIPQDWLPGGMNHVPPVADYVDFSEQDRYAIDAAAAEDQGGELQEHLDAEIGYWSAPEDQQHYFETT